MEESVSQNINEDDEDKRRNDFYLIEYLDKYWKKIIIDHIKSYGGYTFFNVWMRQSTATMVQDIIKLGLYPTNDYVDLVSDYNFSGLVHRPVSEWVTSLIKVVKPDYRR